MRIFFSSILLFLLAISRGQTIQKYTTPPSFWGGESIILQNDGTYIYNSSGCMFNVQIKGGYVNLGNILILTSFITTQSDTTHRIYFDKFTAEDFYEIKYWINTGSYIIRFSNTSYSQLQPYSYFRFARVRI